MSRSAVPSQMQVERLLHLISEKRFLATGHARTAHARDKTRAAWEEVAIKLNSDAGGCIKSWQQWAKYWKDKKSAIKRKVSQMRMARLKTGGGVGDQTVLSSMEERVVALMGGESFAIGDSELEIDPFHPSTQATGYVPVSVLVDPLECTGSFVMSPQESTDQGLESISQQPLPPGPSTSREGNIDLNVSQERHPNIETTDLNNVSQERHPNIETTCTPQPAVPHNSRMASLSPRRRRPLTSRRRILTRTLPSQRQSQMASLTERFIAIEEKRVENERLLIENQSKMFNIFIEVNKTMSRQTEALQELCSATKALAEKICQTR